jgi:hypothetical protein
MNIDGAFDHLIVYAHARTPDRTSSLIGHKELVPANVGSTRAPASEVRIEPSTVLPV